MRKQRSKSEVARYYEERERGHHSWKEKEEDDPYGRKTPLGKVLKRGVRPHAAVSSGQPDKSLSLRDVADRGSG